MKPVEIVSIGGYVFSVEEDACAMVRSYLGELEDFYLKKESGSEIMEGIEERMAELFIEKCGPQGVVDSASVNSVISVLGRPEAIEEDEEEVEADVEEAPSSTREPEKHDRATSGKKLYRDPSNGRVAGVCSGLGTYLNVDPFIFRVLFFVLSILGFVLKVQKNNASSLCLDITVPLIYVVLWVCMPAARTISQKDEMRGEKGTVDAISDRIKSGINEIGEAARNSGGDIALRRLFRIMAVIIGVVFFLVGIIAVAALSTLAIGHGMLGHSFLYNKILEGAYGLSAPAASFLTTLPAIICISLLAIIPFVLLTYLGIRMIFDLKSPRWHPGLCMAVIWIITAVVFAVLVAMPYL